MMNSGSWELVIKTLNFELPSRIPRHAWILPWAEKKHPEWIKVLKSKYPDDIVQAPAFYSIPLAISGDKYKAGTYIDEWGCRFSNPQDGVMGIVREPLILDWSKLGEFRPPENILSLDKEIINAFCRSSDKFVLAGTCQRPLERLQFIRTMEQSMIDLIEQPPELFELLGRIHGLYLKEVELWAGTDVDAITLMDDWGTQSGLMISPDVFRKIFKPMYKEYVEAAHHRGKYVFMHSDGHIMEIYPDLIEIGIDAINSQIFCMGVDKLGERFRGQVTFWGEVDRQNLLPHGSVKEIKRAVDQMYAGLYNKGGVIAQCEFGLEARPENIAAFFEAWNSISKTLEK